MDYIKTPFKNFAKQNTFWTKSAAKIKRTSEGQCTVSTNTTIVTFCKHFLTCVSQSRINNNFWKHGKLTGGKNTSPIVAGEYCNEGNGNLGRAHTALKPYLLHSRNAVMQYLQHRFQAHTKIIYQFVSVYNSKYFTLMHRQPNWRKMIYHTTLYECYFTYYRMSSVRLQEGTFPNRLSNFTIPEPPNYCRTLF
jgi:hypothetical protein